MSLKDIEDGPSSKSNEKLDITINLDEVCEVWDHIEGQAENLHNLTGIAQQPSDENSEANHQTSNNVHQNEDQASNLRGYGGIDKHHTDKIAGPSHDVLSQNGNLIIAQKKNLHRFAGSWQEPTEEAEASHEPPNNVRKNEDQANNLRDFGGIEKHHTDKNAGPSHDVPSQNVNSIAAQGENLHRCAGSGQEPTDEAGATHEPPNNVSQNEDQANNLRGFGGIEKHQTDKNAGPNHDFPSQIVNDIAAQGENLHRFAETGQEPTDEAGGSHEAPNNVCQNEDQANNLRSFGGIWQQLTDARSSHQPTDDNQGNGNPPSAPANNVENNSENIDQHEAYRQYYEQFVQNQHMYEAHVMRRAQQDYNAYLSSVQNRAHRPHDDEQPINQERSDASAQARENSSVPSNLNLRNCLCPYCMPIYNVGYHSMHPRQPIVSLDPIYFQQPGYSYVYPFYVPYPAMGVNMNYHNYYPYFYYSSQILHQMSGHDESDHSDESDHDEDEEEHSPSVSEAEASDDEPLQEAPHNVRDNLQMLIHLSKFTQNMANIDWLWVRPNEASTSNAAQVPPQPDNREEQPQLTRKERQDLIKDMEKELRRLYQLYGRSGENGHHRPGKVLFDAQDAAKLAELHEQFANIKRQFELQDLQEEAELRQIQEQRHIEEAFEEQLEQPPARGGLIQERVFEEELQQEPAPGEHLQEQALFEQVQEPTICEKPLDKPAHDENHQYEAALNELVEEAPATGESQQHEAVLIELVEEAPATDENQQHEVALIELVEEASATDEIQQHEAALNEQQEQKPAHNELPKPKLININDSKQKIPIIINELQKRYGQECEPIVFDVKKTPESKKVNRNVVSCDELGREVVFQQSDEDYTTNKSIKEMIVDSVETENEKQEQPTEEPVE